MPSMYLPRFRAPTMERIWEYIAAFTTKLDHHEGECSICLESIVSDAASCRQARPIKTRCGHIFHGACLASWHQQASTCPYCRQELYLERQYGAPFDGRREPHWLTEEMWQEWCTTEKVEGEGYLVRERGRWNSPARTEPEPEPVVEQVEDEDEDESDEEQEIEAEVEVERVVEREVTWW